VGGDADLLMSGSCLKEWDPPNYILFLSIHPRSWCVMIRVAHFFFSLSHSVEQGVFKHKALKHEQWSIKQIWLFMNTHARSQDYDEGNFFSPLSNWCNPMLADPSWRGSSFLSNNPFFSSIFFHLDIIKKKSSSVIRSKYSFPPLLST